MGVSISSYWLPFGDAETEKFDSIDEAQAVFGGYVGRTDLISAVLFDEAGNPVREYQSGRKAVVDPRDRQLEEDHE